MILFDCDGSFLAEVIDGEELPEKIIRQIVITTPQEERAVRLFLTGGLKVDADGCYALGRDFGSNALSQSSDVSNGNAALGMKPNGSRALAESNTSKGTLKQDYSLEERLQIIDTLSAAIQRNEPTIYPHIKEAETKLLALVQSI